VAVEARCLGVEAVVTGQSFRGAVIGEGNRTVGALRDVLARRAVEKGRIAAAVEQQGGLLATADAITNGALEWFAEDTTERIGGAGDVLWRRGDTLETRGLCNRCDAGRRRGGLGVTAW
jgi:hypothetical protein